MWASLSLSLNHIYVPFSSPYSLYMCVALHTEPLLSQCSQVLAVSEGPLGWLKDSMVHLYSWLSSHVPSVFLVHTGKGNPHLLLYIIVFSDENLEKSPISNIPKSYNAHISLVIAICNTIENSLKSSYFINILISVWLDTSKVMK